MSTIRIGRIEGGSDKDPDPAQAGRVRIRDISRHGPLVKTEDLPFSQMLSPATGTGGFEFNRPPLPGTMVFYYVPEGAENTGYAFPIGIPHGVDSGGDGIPGNYNIPNLGKAVETLMNLPPEIQGILESNRSGLQKLTKKLQEFDSKVKLELLQNLPSHGASFLSAGLRNTPLQNIATALESFDQVLNSGMLSGMGTSTFSLGNLFSDMSPNLIDNLMKALPSELGNGLSNLLNLMPKETGILTPPSGASIGNQINPTVFFTNAVSQLQNVTNFGELSTVLQSLSNPSNSGLDQLPNLINTIKTPFGDLIQMISPLGEITNQLSDSFQSLEKIFSNLVSGISGVKFQTLLSPEGTPFSDLINRFDSSTASTLNAKLQNFSQEINDSFKQMQPFIDFIDSGSLTVAGINFGSTIQHK